MAGRAGWAAAALVVVAAGCAAGGGPGATPPSPTADPAPSVAVVACSDEGTRLSSPAVAAEPGGVRVRFEHPGPVPGDGPWSVGWLDPEGGEILREAAPGGMTELLLPLPPGDESALVCIPPSGDHLSPSRQAHPEVVDAEDRWRSPDLHCARVAQAVGTSSPVPGTAAVGLAHDLLREQVPEEPGDDVVPLRYGASPEPVFGLVRNDVLVATVTFADAEGSGLGSATVERCEELPPPDPRALRVGVTAEIRGPLADVLQVEVAMPAPVAPGTVERHTITFRTTLPDTNLGGVAYASAELAADSGPGRLGVKGVCGPGWAPDGTPAGDPCAAAEPAVTAQPGAPLDLPLRLHGSPEHGDMAPGRYVLELPLTPSDPRQQLPPVQTGTLALTYTVHPPPTVD